MYRAFSLIASCALAFPLYAASPFYGGLPAEHRPFFPPGPREPLERARVYAIPPREEDLVAESLSNVIAPPHGKNSKCGRTSVGFSKTAAIFYSNRLR